MFFNKKKAAPNLTINHEQAEAFKPSPELDLYAAVVTSSLSDKFYETTDDRVTRIRSLIGKVKPEFVAKLAVYAREEMYLRSMPLVLAVELSKIHRGDDLVQKTVNRVVSRADEITELLACYQSSDTRTGVKKLNRLSKQVQKGLNQSFNRFDEYQFAKYNRDGQIKLRDALFLVHPKPKNDSQQVLFDKIAKNELAVPYTWEVELSALGQQKYESPDKKTQAFRNKWEELIDSGKVGYMALLRNLRNILEAEVSASHLQKVCALLSDPYQVARSKQFPFRFLAAYRELKELKQFGVNNVLEALETAIQESVANIAGFDENTRVAVACDVSGSMQNAISNKSKIQYYDIGLTLGMILQLRCKSVIAGFFGDTWKQLNLPKNQILSNVEEMHRRNGEVGYSTNGHLVIRDLIDRKQIVDKVMLFTDCQMWNSTASGDTLAKAWDEYKKIAPNARIYVFDLAGYGQLPLQYKRTDVAVIAGWSDRIFEMMEALEKGGSAVSYINKIVL